MTEPKKYKISLTRRNTPCGAARGKRASASTRASSSHAARPSGGCPPPPGTSGDHPPHTAKSTMQSFQIRWRGAPNTLRSRFSGVVEVLKARAAPPSKARWADPAAVALRKGVDGPLAQDASRHPFLMAGGWPLQLGWMITMASVPVFPPAGSRPDRPARRR